MIPAGIFLHFVVFELGLFVLYQLSDARVPDLAHSPYARALTRSHDRTRARARGCVISL